MPKRKKQLKTDTKQVKSHSAVENKKSPKIKKTLCGSLKGSLTYIGDIVSPVGEDDWEAANDQTS
ncbi:MAG: hypothetical protein KIT34_03580 [Cyanobacteria bacterium TGS_CYA1]|nr:hypothetical protein [Cyanobacteria bacterium TGS_CYA1]